MVDLTAAVLSALNRLIRQAEKCDDELFWRWQFPPMRLQLRGPNGTDFRPRKFSVQAT